MSDKKSSGKGRTRNFASVVYPESAPENYEEILAGTHIPSFISPLHTDKNPDGKEKKEHRHVVIMFDSVKTEEQAKEIFDLIGGVGLERITTLRGYARYLCHLDDPDPNKNQYLPEDVICLNGADYIGIIGLAIDKYKAIFEMVDFCEENDIDSYRELFIYARIHRNDWARVLCDSGTYVIKEYLKSKSWERERHIERSQRTPYSMQKVDPETGEIIDYKENEDV